MKKTLSIATLLVFCATAFAETTVYDQGNIDQDSSYSMSLLNKDATYTFGSIKSPGVSINAVRKNSTCNIEIGSIEADGAGVYISTYIGDVTIGDVKADHFQASTQNGNIKLTGNIDANPESSNVTVGLQDAESSGSIILEGATLSGLALSVQYNALDGIEPTGHILISGNTKLSDVYFNSGSVTVEEGAQVTLENVTFKSRGAVENGENVSTGLVLEDNATLTISGNQALEVSTLSVGSGVSFVVELSDEVFENLDHSEINLFNVSGGDEIDLSGVQFTFTNGEAMKTGTITAGGGGTITVTNSYLVPEPTTATLSLLALAGLAMRRRRK